MNTEDPYYDLYVKETKAHNACALREQALLKDVEFAGREMERLESENQKLRATIPPRPADNRNREQESWDHRFGFLANKGDITTGQR